MEDLEDIKDVLSRNSNKNFVERIIYNRDYPVLDNKTGKTVYDYWKNPEKYKDVSTHSMSWGEIDGKAIVYPTVVQTPEGLKRLNDDEAFDYAIKTKEFIPFESKKEADKFSKVYKKVWKE